MPTGIIAKLDHWEKVLFDMIEERFIAVFSGAAKYESVSRITSICHANTIDRFFTSSNVLVFPGWMEAYGSQGEEKLVPVDFEKTAIINQIEVVGCLS